ncbi:hypothetical protein BGX28_008170, partial [Mortierella sp. GBA30]
MNNSSSESMKSAVRAQASLLPTPSTSRFSPLPSTSSTSPSYSLASSKSSVVTTAPRNKGHSQNQTLESVSTSSEPTQSLVSPSTHSKVATASTPDASMDDMALELLMAKDAHSEVEKLRNEVARLKKVIEFKDTIIARLQAQPGANIDGPPSSSVISTKPSLADTLIPRKQSSTHSHDVGLQPTLSFNIQEQVYASIARLAEPERKVAQEKMHAEEQSMKHAQSKGDLWKDIFKPLSLEGLGNTIVDADDGVRRCMSCGWEVRHGACVNCSNLFSDIEDSDVSQDDTDEESEPDAYDSHDSFINDDDNVEDLASDEGDVDDLYISDDDDDRTRRTRKSINTRRGRTISVDISDDSDDDGSDQGHMSVEGDSGNSEGDTSGGDNGDDNEHDGESDSEVEEVQVRVRSKARRALSRRSFIMLSDDDDDDGKMQ